MRNSVFFPWLCLLPAAFVCQFCVAPPVDAAVYKCVGPDGSTSYSDTPCAANAARIEVQTTADRTSATAGPEIQSASYASPRNGRSIDVTNQLKSLCLHAPGSCTLSCGNQLAGDPDFGQRKYCRIAYVCSGGKTHELQIQEGERSTLSCPANAATTVVRQNAPPFVNSAAASPSSYSASSVTSRVDQRNSAAVDRPTPSQVGADSSEAVALARIVQSLGGDAQSRSLDIFAVFQMRTIGPNDPDWNRSNPRWVVLFKTVKQDLKRDLEPALQAWMADGVRELAGLLQSHLAAADVKQLLAFYRSDQGQRYITFQRRLGAIETQAITQLGSGIMGAGGNPAPTDAPSPERVEARRHLLANSWTALLVPGAMSTEAGAAQGTQQPDRQSSFRAMMDVVAKSQGPDIDALEREYAKDLPKFEAFHQSPAGRSLLSAIRAVSAQAAARPQSSDQLRAALDHSVALHTPSWRATYEAGRSSTSGAQAPRVVEQTNQNPFAGARCSSLDSTARHRTPVDLYGSLAACVKEGKYDVAVVTFALAGAYGRFDTYRVADETAHQAVGILKDFALQSVPTENRDAFQAAVTKVANDPVRLRQLCASVSTVGYPLYEPIYMRNHGLAAFIGPNTTSSPSNAIADSQEMWRKALGSYLNCP
jgi:hypothetical protein